MNAAPLTRAEAQERADRIRTFREELERLEREGVLSLDEAQRAALAAHQSALLEQYAHAFDIDRDVRAKQLSLGMRIASFLGALALAASVFFLFYQFWGWFSPAAQVAILVVVSLASLAATFVIQARDPTGYFTKLAALLAFACFVLNLLMVGRIFNVTPSDNALLPWAALAFILAYRCDQRLLLAMGILCAIAYLSARAATWSGVYWLHFGERPENFFPAAVLLILFPRFVDHSRFAGFDSTYRVFGLLALLLPILMLAHWGAGSYLPLAPALIEGLYQALGFVLSAMAIAIGARRHWPEVVNTGITLFVVFLYTKFYDWWWEAMPKWLFFLVLGLSALLLLSIFRRLRARGIGRPAQEPAP